MRDVSIDEPLAALPPIRSDLDLIPAGRSKNGARLWSIFDRLGNKFYRISWLEFEILSRWHLQDPEKIILDVLRSTTLQASIDDVARIYQFLLQNHLIEISSTEQVAQLMLQKESQIKGAKWLLKSYLFFRIPLVRPDAFLTSLSNVTSWLFTKTFLITMLVCMGVGAALVARDFNSFIEGFSIIQSPIGAMMVVLVLVFAKIVHELGHGLASKHYGCKVPLMGVAFIVLWPILWTDTTDAWRLKERKKRLLIDSGGMIAELSLAAISSILWAVSPEGTFKMAMHLLAGTTWVMTLLVNLNPFMRFDGYYILSDLCDIPNLQNRSFRIARQMLRKIFFNIPPTETESFSQKEKRWMAAYAVGTWVYRLFLFLGIALIVYHFFFKSLGLFLMIVEIWWFILRPIVNEVKQWPELVKKMPSKKRSYLTAMLCCLALFIIFVPFERSLVVPAMIKASLEMPLLSPTEARLQKRDITSGQNVEKDQKLFELSSPELDYELKMTEISVRQQEQEYRQQSLKSTGYTDAKILKQALKKNRLHYRALQEQKNKLSVYTRHDGVVFDVPEHLVEGSWVKSHEFLGMFSSGVPYGIAYVQEKDIERVIPNTKATFFSKNNHQPAVDVILERVGKTSVEFLREPELASLNGGEIKVFRGNGKNLVPATTLYQLSFEVTRPNQDFFKHQLSGYIVLPVSAESIAKQWYRKIASVLIRELSW